MKKKWLIGLATGAMALAMCFGFVACGGEGNGGGNGGETPGGNQSTTDEQIASAAIENIRTMYIEKEVETRKDYTVLGQTRLSNGNFAPIVWTVTSDVADITSYVKIGTMDEATKQVTIGITQGEQDIEYMLKASVTVGEVTKSTEFRHTIPAVARKAAGTEADPYSVANVMDIAEGIGEVGAYYYADADKGQAVPTRVWVTGYIVDCGNGEYAQGAVSWVYIADKYEEGKTYDHTNSLCIFRIEYNDVLTAFSDLKLGAKMTVNGHIEWYQGKSDSAPYAELASFKISDNNYSSVYCNKLEKDQLTPKQQAEQALEAVKDSYRYNAAGQIELPKPASSVVTFAWTSSDSDYTVTDGKLNIGSLPAQDKTFTLTVKATCKGEEAEKTVNVTVKAAVVQPQDGLLLTLDSLFPGIYSSSYSGFNAEHDVGTYKVTTNQVMASQNTSYPEELQLQAKNGTITVSGLFNKLVIVVKTGASYDLNKPTVKCGANEIRGSEDKGVTDTSNASNKVYTITYDLPGEGEYTVTNASGYAMYISSLTFTEGEDTRSAQEKVTAALNALASTFTVTKAGDTTLPASTVNGVTFTWTSSQTTYPIAQTKITVNELPDTPATVEATVTATCGTESVTDNKKTVTITINAKSTTPVGGTLELTRESVFAGVTGTGYAAHDGAHTVGGTEVTTSNVLGTDNYYNGTSNLPFGFTVLQFKKNGSSLTLKGTFTKIVVVLASSHKYDSADKLTITAGSTTLTETTHSEADANFSDGTYDWKLYTIEYDVTTSGEQTITFKGAAHALYVKSITLTGTASGGSVTPEPGPSDALYTLDTVKASDGTNNTYAGNCDIDVNGVTWNLEGNSTQHPWRLGGGKNTALSNQDRKITSKDQITGKVAKIVIAFGAGRSGTNDNNEPFITVNSLTLNVYTADPATGAQPAFTRSLRFTENGTVTAEAGDEDWTNCYYQLVFNLTTSSTSTATGQNSYVTVKSMTFYAASSSETNTDAQKVAAAKAALLEAWDNKEFSKVEDTALPLLESGATLAWTLKTGHENLVALEKTTDSTTFKVLSLPEESSVAVSLTVAISCGEASDSLELTFIINTPPHGTESHPYTVAEALAAGAALEGASEEVYIQGIVLAFDSSTGYNATNVVLGDAYGDNTASGLAIAKLPLSFAGSYLLGNFAKDAKITVTGYLKPADGKVVLDKGDNPITIVEYTDTRATQKKAQDLLDAIFAEPLTLKKAITNALPASDIDGIAVTWSIMGNNGGYELQKDAQGVYSLTLSALPDRDVELSLVATVKTVENGAATATVTSRAGYTLTIKAATLQPADALLLSTDTMYVKKALSEDYADYDAEYTVGEYRVETSGVKEASGEYADLIQLRENDGFIKVSGRFTSFTLEVYTASTLVLPTLTVGTTTIEGKADEGTAVGSLTRYTVTYTNILWNERTITIQNSSDAAIYLGSVTYTEGEVPNTDKPLVDAALAAVEDFVVDADGGYTLPQPSEDMAEEGMTYEWTGGTEPYVVAGTVLKVDKLPDEETTIELQLKITLREETASKTVHVTISAAPHDGTPEHPYTVAEAKELAPASGYYTGSGSSPVQIHVTGYVIDAGAWSDRNSNFINVYISDDKDQTNKEAADAIQVYGLQLGEYLKLRGDLAKGAEITVKGFLQNGSYGIQITYNSGTNATAAAYKDNRTVDEKLTAAIELAKETLNVTVNEDVTKVPLPESLVTGVTLSYKCDAGTVADGHLTISHTEDETSYLITITAAYGDEGDKEDTVTLIAAAKAPDGAVTVDLSLSTYGEDHNWDSNSQWKQLDVDNNIEVTITATDSNSGKLYSDGWRIYQTGSPQITFTAKNGAQIFSIIVTYTTNNDGILAKYGDTDKQYATGSVILVKASEFTFTVANTNGKTNGQVRISAIKVVYTGGIVETDETRVTAALGTLEETMTVTATTTFESKVNGVTLTWSTDTELPEGITFADNKLTITTRPENDLVIVFEVQGTLNQEKQTKTVTVTVKGSKAEEDLKDGFNPITAPVAGTEYYLGMMFDNTWHYFTGEVANKYYLGTTTDISGAQKLTLEQTEGGWLIKFGTQFVEIVQSASDSTKFNAVISDAQTAGHVWKWNETYSIFTMAVAGNDYFIGTYYNSSQKKTFDTMSASKISYASSSTNYPAKLGLYKEPTGGGGSTTPGGGGSETPTGDSIVYNFSSSSVAADTYVFADTDAALAFFKGVNGAAELSSVQEGFAYIYPGNTSGGGFQGNGCLKLGGSGSKKGDVTLVFTKKVKQVVINCQAWNDKNISWVNVNADADASSKAGQQPTAGSATDLTFTLETASTTVRLNSTKYTYVFSLTVYFE